MRIDLINTLVKNIFKIHLSKKNLTKDGIVDAGNTTYTADSHPNSTRPTKEHNMNVNGFKNTEDTQKQTRIY